MIAPVRSGNCAWRIRCQGTAALSVAKRSTRAPVPPPPPARGGKGRPRLLPTRLVPAPLPPPFGGGTRCPVSKTSGGRAAAIAASNISCGIASVGVLSVSDVSASVGSDAFSGRGGSGSCIWGKRVARGARTSSAAACRSGAVTIKRPARAACALAARRASIGARRLTMPRSTLRVVTASIISSGAVMSPKRVVGSDRSTSAIACASASPTSSRIR